MSLKYKLISPLASKIALVAIAPTLLLTNTRTAIFALTAALFYLLGRKYYKWLIASMIISAIAISCMTFTRPMYWKQPSMEQLMSSRTPMWEMSGRAIKKQPLFGWGFDGFGIAYPYVKNPKVTPIVVRLGNISYDYLTKNRLISTKEIPTYKAHNLILDTTLSVGILGLLSYLALWAFYWNLAMKSSLSGIEAVVVAYLVFGLSWFECAQYTHITWWALSVATASLKSYEFCCDF